MSGSGKLALAAIASMLLVEGAAGQSVRPVPPPMVRNPSVGDQIARIKMRQLPRLTIPMNPALAPPLDMAGWTAITNGAATGSPWILSFGSKALLMVGGKDNRMYGAEPDMLAPKEIDSGAWAKMLDAPSSASVLCQRSSFKDHDETPGDQSIDCLVSAPGQTSLVHLIAIADPAIIAELASFGYAPFTGEANVSIPGTPGPAFWLSQWKAPGAAKDWSATALPIAAWDGNMKLSYAVAATDYRKVTTASWQAQNFYAFALPACDLNLGACMLADGGGDKLQIASIDPGTGKLATGPMLPAVPGGGGAAKGEISLVSEGSGMRVFARGKDGKLYMASGKTPQTLSWTSLGGSVAVGARPSCASFKNGITCAIRASDNRIYMRRIASSGSGL